MSVWLGYYNGKITHIAPSRKALESIPLAVFDKIEKSEYEYELINGDYIRKDQIRNEKVIAERKLEYPSIEDQLDMLYWDKVNGTNIWEATISRIKKRHPKKS